MFHRYRRTAKHASTSPTSRRQRSAYVATGLMALALAAGAVTIIQPQGQPQFEAAPVDLTVPLDMSPSQLGQWCIDRKAAGVQGLSTRARNWLTDCIAIFGGAVTPSPTGSPSSTPTTSPSASPTISPSPSPTVTPTPSPSTSTATPTPSPTSTATGCMPKPSACGWPDETNTGTKGTLTVVNGSVTLSTPGQVYENRDVRGCITVTAKNVTIRNVKITCGASYVISVRAGDPNVDGGWQAADAALVVEDVDINMSGQLEGKAIAFSGYTLRRAHIHGGSDCGHFGVNVVIEDTFCNIPAGGPNDGPHYDGYQSDGGRNIVIRHNTIRVPYSQTAAILMSTNTSPIRDVSIVNNLVAGGGYSIYCGTSAGGPVLGTFTFSGNVVARTYFARGGYWGPTTECPAAGWRWD